MSKFRSLVAAVAVAVAVAACGDDDPTGINSGDELSQDEIQEVLLALFGAFGAVNIAPAGVGPAAVSVSESFNLSAPCEGGGNIAASGSVSGDFDEVSGAFDVSYALDMDPQGCVVPTTDGSVTMNGDPALRLDMDYVGSQTQISLTGSYSGGISFTASGGRSGSCAFDVDFDADIDLQGTSSTTSASGTICGVSASGFQTIDF